MEQYTSKLINNQINNSYVVCGGCDGQMDSTGVPGCYTACDSTCVGGCHATCVAACVDVCQQNCTNLCSTYLLF